MSDFAKILSHAERDRIIEKLVKGETPKDVATYLKIKYHEKDQSAQRLPASLLEEFVEKYLNQYNFLSKVIEDEKNGKTDKLVFQSLLNNKAWKDRVANLADDEIDFKKKLQSLILLVEARTEQVFDKIQENPGGFKGDYVLVKYLEVLINLVEKADKIINNRPDKLIQHNVSVQMVEQHSVVFQEAIRDTLAELDPNISSRFMELLTQKLNKLQPDGGDKPIKVTTIEARGEEVKSLLAHASKFDEYDFDEDLSADEMPVEGSI